MTMTAGASTTFECRFPNWLVITLACIFVTIAGVTTGHAQVVAVVYGEPITALDIEQRTKFEQLAGQKTISRQDVLELLINDKLKIREGKRWGVAVTDAEVDEAFAGMAGRMRLKPDQLEQVMLKQGTNANAIKSRIRADIAWQRLVRGRFSSTLSVGEKDVLEALGSKTVAEKDAVSYDYTLRPVLFVVADGAAEQTFEARKREAEALRGRFLNCDDGLALIRTMRDVAIRDKIFRSTTDIPTELRGVLDTTEVGHLTPPEITKHGVEMFALCERVAGQGDTPQKKQARDAVFAERFEQKAKVYLAEVRRAAMIEYK